MAVFSFRFLEEFHAYGSTISSSVPEETAG